MDIEKCLKFFDEKIKGNLKNPRFGTMHSNAELSTLLNCRCKLKQWIEEQNESPEETQETVNELDKALLGIEDELAATKKYLDMHTDTNDPEIKTMAQEELRHAAKLITLTTPKAISVNEKTKLAKLNAKYQLLAQKLA